MSSLYAKLSLSVLVLVAILGAALVWITHVTSDLYSQEVTQRLNQSIAMYVTDEEQLIDDGAVNRSAIEALAGRAMTINPTVEIYVLNPEGEILSHVFEEDSIVKSKVSLAPLQQFLAGQSLPIMGDDPRHRNTQKIFSVSPIMDDGQTAGYLYAVLGGEKYDSIRASIEDSLILKTGLATIVGSLLVAALAAMGVFFILTRRLADLRRKLDAFQYDDPDTLPAAPSLSGGGDEVDELTQAFHDMSTRIAQQYEALKHLDNTRRELIANVSHDLRTPLASLQGYIETLLIKENEFSAEDKQQYLRVAYKHSQRLSGLISELFELAKLDSGTVELKTETFSLTELVFDSVQDFELMARDQSIQLNIDAPDENLFVRADIALIQRVLQNLIDNAIRHTPAGRSITLKVRDSMNQALIEVADTGTGIAKHEIPHIFERFYQSKQQEHSGEIGSGLGLAIVKKILDLHQSHIHVKSELNRGTSFAFDLPLQAA